MSKFNPVEKYFADILSKFPNLKNKIKIFYSLINYLINKKRYKSQSQYKFEKILSDENNESFFGYYDKSPLNSTGKYIAFHQTRSGHSRLTQDPGHEINIMLYDKENSEYKKISSSKAFNLQQGSRLMWLNEKEF
ncbi:MAG: hypothetical protein KKD38_02850, partial [Candidatus Delongbacteria bacterium]|nr:hypothetical protein [Candidatus Delongbacteria bacterium]